MEEHRNSSQSEDEIFEGAVARGMRLLKEGTISRAIDFELREKDTRKFRLQVCGVIMARRAHERVQDRTHSHKRIAATTTGRTALEDESPGKDTEISSSNPFFDLFGEEGHRGIAQA